MFSQPRTEDQCPWGTSTWLIIVYAVSLASIEFKLHKFTSLLVVLVILSVIWWGGEGEWNNVYLAEKRICKTSRKKNCMKGERNNVICKYIFWWEFPVFYLRKNFRLESKTNKGTQNEGMRTEFELVKQWQQFNLSASRWRAQESRSTHIKKEGKTLHQLL